jgi:hypothetical protein
MDRVFYPYTAWEDYMNGMYKEKAKDIESLTTNAIIMLTDIELFLDTCKKLLIDWPIASAVHLTDRQCNRKAWLGQAACSYKFGATETATRTAWARMLPTQRIEANNVALKIITHFEQSYENKNQRLYSDLGA